MVRLLAFLGNPGKNYEKTRHNFGFIVGDFFVDKKGLNNKWQNKFHGLYIKDGDNILLKPQTFMNISGQSVYEAAIFFKVKPEDVLVVHDDIELPFGKVKLQLGGGMGGHNGLRSIKQQLGTDMFSRLRLGVGRPEGKMVVADYVLGRFTPLEENSLDKVLEEAVVKTTEFLKFGTNGVM